MKRVILVMVFNLFLSAACFAQSNQTQDTFTITTYYPAPHGVYGTMRIYPGQLPSEGVAPGVLYYNATEDMLKFHNNTTWVNVTGGGLWTQNGNNITNTNPGGNVTVSGDICIGAGICLSRIASLIDAQPLAGPGHNQGDCSKAGGMLVASDVTYPLCRFNSTSCSSGWTPYKDYTTTAITTVTPGQRIGGSYGCTVATGCSTGWHSWGKGVAVESCMWKPVPQCCYSCQDPIRLDATITQIGCF